jgi:hypothetical protein
MPIELIDGFEFVDIDGEQAELSRFGLVPCQGAARPLLERGAVWKSGQRVMQVAMLSALLAHPPVHEIQA